MRFSPANLVASNACQISAAHPEPEMTSAGFTDSALFGSFLRQQIPSEPGKTASSETPREPAAEESAAEGSALASALAGQKFAASSGSVPVTNPPGVSPNARPALPQGVRQIPWSAATPTDRTGDAAKPAEAENAAASKEPNALLVSDGSAGEIGNATPALEADASSGPAALAAQTLAVPSASAPTAGHSVPDRLEERSERETSGPKHKCDPTEKTRPVTADGGLSRPSHAVGSPDAAASTITAIPAAQSGTAGGFSTPSHQNSPVQSTSLSQQTSPGHSASSLLQPATPRASRTEADGTTPNLSEKEAAPADLSGLRIPVHNTQTVPAAATSVRTFEGRHGAGAPAANGQHGSSTVSAAGATQAVPLLQGTGLTGYGVSGHRSVTGADQSLRPSATLERMDAADAPRLLESSSQKLTVGVRDAGLGWIEIRTHAVAGQVAATLATGSHEAQAVLAAELPSIRSTLINQHVALRSLGAEQFSASSGGGGTGSNSSDSGNPVRQPLLKSKWDPPPAQSDAGENLSYINVRV